MPHVDEGILHAYLDGALDALVEAGALPHGITRDSVDAHLAQCMDCRALLTAERALRAGAGAILADAAAVDVVVPPFAQLTTAPRPHRPRRTWPLAWAASMLLALGAGWWGSELYRDQARNGQFAQEDVRPESKSSSAAVGTRVEREAGAPAEPQSVVADAATMQSAAGRSSASGEREQRLVSGDTALATVAAQPPAAVDRATFADRSNVLPRDSGRGATGAVRELDRIIVTGAVTGVLPPALQPRVAAAAPFALNAAPPPAASDPLASRVMADVVNESRLVRFRSDLAELDAGRLVVVPTTATNADEMPLLHVEGGETPAIQRGLSVGIMLTRLTQRTLAGVDVEIIVWRDISLALEQLVVTGNTQRAADAQQQVQRSAGAAQARMQQRAESAKLSADAVAHTVLVASDLPDGREQILLHLRDHDVLVAVRARVTAAELQTLVESLTPLRRD